MTKQKADNLCTSSALYLNLFRVIMVPEINTLQFKKLNKYSTGHIKNTIN